MVFSLYRRKWIYPAEYRIRYSDISKNTLCSIAVKDMLMIRDMKIEDCEAVAEIDRNTFSTPFSVEGYRRELEDPKATTLVAEENGSIIGYANLWNVAGDVTLNNIAVAEGARSKGAGAQLMEEILRRFADCEFITLEVRRSNLRAVEFYKRFGFMQVGLRRNFYEKPTEDALLMTLDLSTRR